MKPGASEKSAVSVRRGWAGTERRRRHFWSLRRSAQRERIDGPGAPEQTGQVESKRPEGEVEAAGSIRPITETTDPRWVLAVRTAEQLQGPILTLDRRERLVRLGKLMGLTAFEANLIIAIVQDQARRGIPPENCPTAGLRELEMIRPPRERSGLDGRQVWRIAAMVTALLAMEVVILMWWLG